MVTIKDVAARAGVSTATVSRVLNGAGARPDLVEAVQAAAKVLNYVPNRNARSLRRQSSEVVALIVPDIENPFFTSVARGVEDVASKASLSVVLCNSDDDPRKEERYLRIARSEMMAGVIIAPASPKSDLSVFLDGNKSVVVIDRLVQGARTDRVMLDNISLGEVATSGLVAKGFRAIACITGPRSVATAQDRVSGWRKALAAAGLPARRDHLQFADFRVEGGRRALAELLDLASPPDAVVAANNLVGVGVLQALAELNRELGVAVIGDLPFATSELQDIDVYSLRPREMGMRAASLLMQRIAGDNSAPREIVVADGPESLLETDYGLGVKVLEI